MLRMFIHQKRRLYIPWNSFLTLSGSQTNASGHQGPVEPRWSSSSTFTGLVSDARYRHCSTSGTKLGIFN